MINFCCIHLLVIEVFFDYSGIFQLTVLIRRIDFCLHGYDLGNDYDRDCVKNCFLMYLVYQSWGCYAFLCTLEVHSAPHCLDGYCSHCPIVLVPCLLWGCWEKLEKESLECL